MKCEQCDKIMALQVALDKANEKLKYVCGDDAPQYDCEYGRELLNKWADRWKYEVEHKNDVIHCRECEYAKYRSSANIICTRFYGSFDRDSYCSYGKRVTNGAETDTSENAQELDAPWRF